MGAGIVKPQPDGSIRINIASANTSQRTNRTTGGTQSSNARSQTGSAGGTCEDCAVSFSAFKKKKPCKDCGRNFCSACTSQIVNTTPKQQQCRKCQIILAGNFTRSQLTDWKPKDLKALLVKQNVNISMCTEKGDLIDLIFTYFGSGNPHLNRRNTEQERLVEELVEKRRQEEQSEPSRRSPRPPPPSSTASSNNTTSNPPPVPPTQAQSNDTTLPGQPSPAPPAAGSADGDRLRQRQEQEMRDAMLRMGRELEEEEKKQPHPENPHLKLDDIQSEEEIESLNIRSLKRVLLNNFVDYKGCVERWELLDRVKRLWKDHQANKKKVEEQRKISDDPSAGPSVTSNDDDICKICMDAVIDCVLLECGHMATCTNCGKQLSECPICRQYVVRAVHTFRS